MPKSTAVDRTIQFLPKARFVADPTSLLGDPAVAIRTERRSGQSIDPDDWHTAGEPLVLPVEHLEGLIFAMRQAAREAVA